MGRNNYFQFKQFKIIQQHAAMKVGTDGVLLGAWTNINLAETILDIGTGTGLIALMLAQRSEALVTGIEIEENAALEAMDNVSISPWKQRIEILHTSLQSFKPDKIKKFDLIVSNPPYFSNSKKSKCDTLAIAKHNHLLSYSDLIKYSAPLLSNSGRLALILPIDSELSIKQLAENQNLFLKHETVVSPNQNKKPHRILLEYCKKNVFPSLKDEIFIHEAHGINYTEKFKNLITPFYLNY